MPAFTDIFCVCSSPSIARANSGAGTEIVDSGAVEPSIQVPFANGTDDDVETKHVQNGLGLALFYQADASDPIDSQLSQHLAELDFLTGANLAIRRLQPGEYMVAGKRACLFWDDEDQLIVCEATDDSEDASSGIETPLPAYLQQAAGVAALLSGHSVGASPVTRVPKTSRLSFPDAPLPLTSDDGGADRVKCMKVACEQARLREQAAGMYEQAEHLMSLQSKPNLLPKGRLGSPPRQLADVSNVLGTSTWGSVNMPTSVAFRAKRSTTPPPSSGALLQGSLRVPMVGGFRNEVNLMSVPTVPQALTTVRVR